MTGRTGEKCLLSGVYRCTTHPSQKIPLSKGETFPPCKGDGRGHSAVWVLVSKA